MDRTIRQMRSIASDFKTREDGEALTIEGYFAVFNSNYDIAQGMSESIAPGAFTDTLSGDIRALVNHDTTLVLGRTTAHTLELSQDERGLWGKIVINPKDGDAMNLYERVKRGDVNQCSFGFDISNGNDFCVRIIGKRFEVNLRNASASYNRNFHCETLPQNVDDISLSTRATTTFLSALPAAIFF